jgi:hypothetical protein
MSSRLSPINNAPVAADTQAIYDLLLNAVRYAIPPFEFWEPLIIGGLSGKYSLIPPFDTPCEYRVLYLSSTDVASAAIYKGQAFIAISNATQIGGAPNTISAGSPGVVLVAAANTSAPGPDEWMPFAQNDQLTIDLVVASSHAAWVGILFRRRRNASGVYVEGS